MRAVADFFLFTSLFISCVAVIMTRETVLLFGEKDPGLPLSGFVFFSTLASYNLHWYFTPHSVVEKQRSRWSATHRRLQLFLLVLGAIGSAWFFQYLISHTLPIAIAVLLTFLYTAPKLPLEPFRILKRIAVGKTLFLTFVWTYVTVVLPLLLSGAEWSREVIFFLTGKFFFLYAICIIFDYRDREQDRKEGIRSMITFLNEKGIWKLFGISLLISLLGFAGAYLFGLDLLSFLACCLPLLILPAIFRRARHDFSDYLYDFILDGMMAFSAIVHLLRWI